MLGMFYYKFYNKDENKLKSVVEKLKKLSEKDDKIKELLKFEPKISFEELNSRYVLTIAPEKNCDIDLVFFNKKKMMLTLAQEFTEFHIEGGKCHVEDKLQTKWIKAEGRLYFQTTAQDIDLDVSLDDYDDIADSFTVYVKELNDYINIPGNVLRRGDDWNFDNLVAFYLDESYGGYDYLEFNLYLNK